MKKDIAKFVAKCPNYQQGCHEVCKKEKLSPGYVGPFYILRRIGKFTYELEFPNDLTYVHPTFHDSLLKKCVGDPTSIVPLEGLGVKENLSYEEVLVEILDQKV
ncbi:hypothetical protein MTR67_026858 [Solanum verrucosum]|uniref:Tf2-1-like SH3-like domain-containing protein n=1 Tax=Solanum verrucosum TaxID=315347 RepID=A0AAF0TZX5_SOLVR|nr:hypothetical protein MTR67_026858 [Solanum verrucosum]